MAASNRTYSTPDTAFEGWRRFEDDPPPPLRPVRIYVITPEMRANDERQRKQREAAQACVWPIKATLTVENLRGGK